MEETAESFHSQLSVFEALLLMIAFDTLMAALSNKNCSKPKAKKNPEIYEMAVNFQYGQLNGAYVALFVLPDIKKSPYQ